jgi:hypothetical protein
MGDEGDIWREVKEYRRQQQDKYEKTISPVINKLIVHPECKDVGDHWRIGGVWDFWWTGTVRNIRTGENISIKELARQYL